MKFLLLLPIFAGALLACDCPGYLTTQDLFCQSDFVAHVNVTDWQGSEMPGGDQYFTVDYIQVYKKPDGVEELPAKISTGAYAFICGVTLDVGAEYLLGGTYVDGELRVSLCGLVLSWGDLAPGTEDFLNSPNCAANTTPEA